MNLKKLYHGTSSKIDSFRSGTCLTDDPIIALGYASHAAIALEERTVRIYKVSLCDSLRIADSDDLKRANDELFISNDRLLIPHEMSDNIQIRTFLLNKGFDAIRFLDYFVNSDDLRHETLMILNHKKVDKIEEIDLTSMLW